MLIVELLVLLLHCKHLCYELLTLLCHATPELLLHYLRILFYSELTLTIVLERLSFILHFLFLN